MQERRAHAELRNGAADAGPTVHHDFTGIPRGRADGLFEADPPAAWSVAERLARTLRVPAAGPDALVSTVVEEAVALIGPARSCGVIVTPARGDLQIVAATDAVPRRLDAMQQRLGSGPCLTAARKQIVVRVHDMATDTRWAPFRAEALELGVGSMLCLPLYVDEDALGTLSLYGPEPGGFRTDAEPVARLLAALAAIALAESRLAEQLRDAMHSRDLIGQAKGILMREHRITADEAFALLRRYSQHTNTKLLDVARKVAEAGTLDA